MIFGAHDFFIIILILLADKEPHLNNFPIFRNRKRRLNSVKKRKRGLRNPHNLWPAEAMLQPSGAAF